MSEQYLAAQPLSRNSRKLLAYALLGYLYRLLDSGWQECKCPLKSEPFICRRCQSAYYDAFDIFGLTPLFESAAHADMPPALRDVILSLDEYESLPRDVGVKSVRHGIGQLFEYLADEVQNDDEVVRPVFKLFMPDEPK